MEGKAAPLAKSAAALREGRLDVADYVAEHYDRLESREPEVRAWVDGAKDRPWVDAEAAALEARYPDPAERPPLYGVPVGVKDIFQVDGLPTKAGSDLPPGRLAGPQASVVTALREAGALVLGKTVTTEFAYFAPGPTRNPRDTDRTPGGSSSGSAAAVAAGMCPLALGTQTVGSVIRPASFCGVVGFKPSYGRIPTDGVLPLAESVDHVGLFTRTVAGADLAASVCVDDWTPVDVARRPTLGVPDDAYLDQASAAARETFERQVDALDAAGYEVRRVDALADVDAVNDRHEALVAAEAALAHREWFDEFGDRYAAATADLVTDGRSTPVGELADARRGRRALQQALHERMDDHGVDLWVSPAAPGPAPVGIESTGNPVMNLPWTHAGLPTVTVPGGEVDGLPLGLQCSAAFGADESLLDWAGPVADVLVAGDGASQ